MIETMIAVLVVVAITMMLASFGMAAQNTGLAVPDNAILVAGDPGMIWLVAEGAITPGDNVEPGSVAASEAKACDNSAEEYLGTADLNKTARAIDLGTDPISTDFATGDMMGVITGACHVRKIAEGTVGSGKALRPGTTAGTACLVDATSTAKYFIGRALMGVADGEAFIMRQV